MKENLLVVVQCFCCCFGQVEENVFVFVWVLKQKSFVVVEVKVFLVVAVLQELEEKVFGLSWGIIFTMFDIAFEIRSFVNSALRL